MKFMHYLPLLALSIFQQTKAQLNCIFSSDFDPGGLGILFPLLMIKNAVPHLTRFVLMN